MRHLQGSQQCAGSGFVLDDEGLLGLRGQLIGNEAAQVVGEPPRRKWHDDCDGSGRIACAGAAGQRARQHEKGGAGQQGASRELSGRHGMPPLAFEFPDGARAVGVLLHFFAIGQWRDLFWRVGAAYANDVISGHGNAFHSAALRIVVVRRVMLN